MDQYITAETFTASWQRVCSTATAVLPALRGAELHTIDDLVHGYLLLTLETFMLQEVLAEEEYEVTNTFTHPGSMWQHIKQRRAEKFFMKHFVRRFPVKGAEESVTTVVHFKSARNFPYYPETRTGRGHIVQIVTATEVDPEDFDD